MRIVLQKVQQASVTVIDEQTGLVDTSFTPQHIQQGYVLLVGVSDRDGTKEVEWVAKKIAHMRLFKDENHAMNISLDKVQGEILSISQFTLYANIRKGNRPSFIEAGKPEHAKLVWKQLNEALASYGYPVKEGQFGAHMQVSLVNDGPVTITINTEELLG
ncbi:MAG: D-aminoacyl-tRNA deacylase [Bifidobacteriaceae bacterium]|nr:D-aminoacyl-tRNA deacylase [Bifidobacteriaceae bacterium]